MSRPIARAALAVFFLATANVARAQDDGLPAPVTASTLSQSSALVQQIAARRGVPFTDEALEAATTVLKAHPARTASDLLEGAALRAQVFGSASVTRTDVLVSDVAQTHLFLDFDFKARQLLGTDRDAQLHSLFEQEAARGKDPAATAAAPATGSPSVPAPETSPSAVATATKDPRVKALKFLTYGYDHPNATNPQPAQSWAGSVDPSERDDPWATRQGERDRIIRQAIAEWDAGGLTGEGWDAALGAYSPRDRVIIQRLLSHWGRSDAFTNRSRFAEIEKVLASSGPAEGGGPAVAKPAPAPAPAPLASESDPRFVQLMGLTASLDRASGGGITGLPRRSGREWAEGQKEQILRRAIGEYDAGGLTGEGWQTALPSLSAQERVIAQRLSPYWRGADVSRQLAAILGDKTAPGAATKPADEPAEDATLAAIRARGAQAANETGMSQVLAARTSEGADRTKAGER